MSPSDANNDKDAGPPRLRSFRVLGILQPIPIFVIFGCLAVIAIGLIAIGTAVAYELTTSVWAVPVGIGLGLSLALLLGRDFLRWRLSWAAIVAVALFAFIFMVAY